MIAKLKIVDSIRYLRIISVIGILFSGYYSLNVWTNGGEYLLALPTWFYVFVLFSAIYAISFLMME